MNRIPYPECARDFAIDLFEARFTPATDVQALLWLASQTAGGIVEIGCNEGRTTRDLARAFPDRTVIGVDYSGEGVMCEKQRAEGRPTALTLGMKAKTQPNVILQDLPSERFFREFESECNVSGQFPGLIFIDGNHSYSGVKRDTEMAIDILLAAKSKTGHSAIIAWHDYYPNPPAWVGVQTYVEDLDRFFPVTTIHGTWLAFSIV